MAQNLMFSDETVGLVGGKFGVYGATPVVQRATATTHTTTNAAVSSSFGATQLAILQEIMNTLIALGFWAA